MFVRLFLFIYCIFYTFYVLAIKHVDYDQSLKIFKLVLQAQLFLFK